MLDFGALGGGGGKAPPVIEPRKIFTTLVRNPRFRFPSANQGEVLDKWFDVRTRRDNTIKMNTGSGKMLVGLLALQSSINENCGPAVYITPDNYLQAQVLNEASDLGIAATNDINSADFLSSSAILVVNVHKLFNGRSQFGVSRVKVPIGTIAIDDAHACLTAIEGQFRIEIPASSAAFKELLSLFEPDLSAQSAIGLIEVKAEDPNALMIVPFWAWHDKKDRVLTILHKFRDDDELAFSWPLLKNVIPLSQCVFGARA